MELTLHYQGALKSNGSSAHKQEIRRHFHGQLRTLWTQKPLELDKQPGLLYPRPSDEGGRIVERGAFSWAPLVREGEHVFADLHVTWLRDGPPGAIVHSADIDNRLKTLFDALQIPPAPNAIPSDDLPRDGEDPFFVLLEDDKLIARVSIETDQFLTPGASKNDVVLLVHARTRVQGVRWDNAVWA